MVETREENRAVVQLGFSGAVVFSPPTLFPNKSGEADFAATANCTTTENCDYEGD
jgi:hypothetical protein